MSRTTLKLPPRPAADPAASDTRSRPHKPVRGGAKPPRASRPTVPAPAEPAAAADPTPTPPAKPRPARPQAAPSRAAATRPKRGPEEERRPRAADRAKTPAKAPVEPNPQTPPAAPRAEAATPPWDEFRAAARRYREGSRDAAAPRSAAPRSADERPAVSRPAAAPDRPPPAAAVSPAAKAPAAVRRAGGIEPPRLSKRLSELGLCSRREADEWIENGWVRVDGVVVDTLGSRVSPRAKIDIDPAARQHQSEAVTILLHKPIGYVSGQAEDGHQPASVLLRPENRWPEDTTPTRFKLGHLRGLAPAGRLDIDSTGLLVFTQDGRVARRLVGDDSMVEKEYLVRVEGSLDEAGMKRLNHGLTLDGVKLKPARVSWQNEEQLRFVLREGRKRQIRRMCELVGLKVVGLKRIRIGSVVLGKLPPGQWRYLRTDEKF